MTVSDVILVCTRRNETGYDKVVSLREHGISSSLIPCPRWACSRGKDLVFGSSL